MRLPAAIFIGAPVAGLRPIRSAVDVTFQVPKPESVTASPDGSDLVTALTMASSALAESALVRPVSAAMLLTSSGLPVAIRSLLVNHAPSRAGRPHRVRHAILPM